MKALPPPPLVTEGTGPAVEANRGGGMAREMAEEGYNSKGSTPVGCPF